MANDKKKTKTGKKELPRLSNIHKPEDMTLEEWQRTLRLQAAAREKLTVTPIAGGREGYFKVSNPESLHRYSVVYRGPHSSWNYCSCPDFRTNRLGTCKHIEAVGIADEGRYASCNYTLPDRTTVYLDYRGERRVRIRFGGRHSSQMRKLAADYFDDDKTLRPEMYEQFGDFLASAQLLDSSFRCFDDAFDFILDHRERVKRNKIADENPAELDSLLKVKLYPYQRRGAEFAFRQGRVIIADEMGLGKTIQAIAAALLMQRFGFAQSAWIVCPTSLKFQWKSEIEKFSSSTACVVEGTVKARADMLDSDSAFFKIISYHSLANTIKFGVKNMPDVVIYDEVQRLKNWDTKMSKTMRELHSKYVVALSGTPLENKLSELYSVMQLVDQYQLGPYWKFTNDTTSTDDTGRVVGYRNLNIIGELIRPVLIRRTKKEVQLQMPERVDKNLFVTVTNEQQAIHDDCKWNVGILMHRWKRLGFLPEKDRRRLMNLLSMMRMVADSTFILDQETRNDTKIDEALNIVSDIIESGNEKIVIFSQWERMQRVMAEELDKRGIDFRFLHGGVPSAKRGKLIEDFLSKPECRVFLSTDAGGTGLNLQAASVVINFDLPWNPAVLEQRIARVYRLGQNRQVQVINMVSVGTIEENMLDTLAFKSGLFEGVLDGGDDAIVLSDKKFDRIAQLVEDNVLDEGEEKQPAEPSPAPIAAEPYKEFDEEYDDYREPDESPEYFYDDDLYENEDDDEDKEWSDLSDSSDMSGTSDQSDKPATTPQDVISKGVEFLGGLAKALSTPESRQQLVDSLVKEDPDTGQVSLNIPVADKKTVSDIVDMFAGLMASFKK